MDETLFYIVIFLIYVVFQVLGGKKKKKKRPLPTGGQPLPGTTDRPARPANAEPTLEEALFEIRQALGMEPPPKPVPQPPVEKQPSRLPPRTQTPPRPKPRPVRSHGPSLAETAPQKSWSSEFKAHQTHFADSDFEEHVGEGDRFGIARTRLQRTIPAPKPKPIKLPLAEHKPPPPTNVSAAKVVRQLKDPEAAREAFLLSEILGPPRGLKRR